MNLQEFAKNIEKRENGIYFSKSNSNISYPEDGNVKCFQIEQDSFWFNHRNNVIVEAVKKYCRCKTFFDIGGGNGFVAKGLQDAGINVVLVEPGPSGAINAQKRNIKNIVCSTLEDAQFEKASLDSLGLFDVIEHIKDDYKFLSNINTYLNHDGLIFITVPAYNFLWSSEDSEAGHFRRYTLFQLNELLAKCGFKVEYSTYIFSILPLPIFLFRHIPTRLGIKNKSNQLRRSEKTHSYRTGFIHNIINRFWKWELKKIKQAKKIRFGGSCFIVAKKSNPVVDT